VATRPLDTSVPICESIQLTSTLPRGPKNLATLGFVPKRFFANSIGLLSRVKKNYSPFTNLSLSYIYIHTHTYIFNCFLPSLPCIIIQHQPTRFDPDRESGRLSCFQRIPLTIRYKNSTTDCHIIPRHLSPSPLICIRYSNLKLTVNVEQKTTEKHFLCNMRTV